MSLSPDLRQRIETLLAARPVVLFMKGSPDAPRCGFSAKAAGILNSLVGDYAHVDVLEDPEIREGIKAYGQWPTIPQLYVRGELVGGSDIIEQLLNSGELHGVLGLPAPERIVPRIEITPAAARQIAAAMQEQAEGVGLHLSVDGRYRAQFRLGPVQGGEVVVETAGLRLHLDLVSAAQAEGLRIDWVDTPQGGGLAIHHPKAPPPVQALSVEEASRRLPELTLIDVRPPSARAHAPFPHPHEVLDEESHDRLAALPRDRPLAFLCHHGHSSRQAAEHFRGQGFRAVFNIEGGIDAWAERIDPAIPRY